MADVTIRHGDGSHFMRPDRVYRTSVLSPMMGYQPQADVQSVAMMFTQGPARGMMLDGLGMPGPIQRWLARIQAWIAERKAQKLMQTQLPPTPGPMHPPQAMAGLGMPGPASAMALQISPHLATQMSGMLDIMQSRYGTGYPAAAASAMVSRPLHQWYR